MSDPEISVVITCHAEPTKWIERCIAAVHAQIDSPQTELIVVADNPTSSVQDYLNTRRGEFDRLICPENGDLGESRNAAVRQANGRYVAFCDADDLWGNRWLRQAYDYARELWPTTQDFALHSELNLFFGQNWHAGIEKRLHLCIGDDNPNFDAKALTEFNPWSALAFAPRGLFERFPYFRASQSFGYEDWEWACRTIDAGVTHRVVPASLHAVRRKESMQSMAQRNIGDGLTIPKMALFDRRDLPVKVPPTNGKAFTLTEVQLEQIRALHNEIGEYQILLEPTGKIAQYPSGSTFDAQAELRDQIGAAKHAVLVQELVRGGGEKYAIDWAAALGSDAVLIETAPGDSPWLAKAQLAGVRVVRFNKRNLPEQAQAQTLQRALIQADLESVAVFNSVLGLIVLNENAGCLAKRVILGSFATIPVAGMQGFWSCPPFWMERLPANVTVVTDNDAHAEKVNAFREIAVEVIPPKCEYAGGSKLSKIEKKHHRVLWAGRGSWDKQPQLLPAVAALLEGKADIHVWGDVQPMNGPENLKLRGPFDAFEKIDGSYDCFLMTSLNEGAPNTAMEAVLAGLPVVGPNVGALPELATMLYNGYEPMTIASALMSALDGKAINPDAARCVIYWAEMFSSRVRRAVSQ